jgi:hypothetical protein
MFALGSNTDLVQIDGFWSDIVPLTGSDSFLTPNAMWTIYDTDRRVDGSEYFGSYRANFVSVTPVPEPSSIAMLVTGLSLMTFLLRRKQQLNWSQIAYFAGRKKQKPGA